MSNGKIRWYEITPAAFAGHSTTIQPIPASRNSRILLKTPMESGLGDGVYFNTPIFLIATMGA